MKPSSCTEGHRNLSRDKSPGSVVPRIPNLKSLWTHQLRLALQLQMLMHVNLCWWEQTNIMGWKQKLNFSQQLGWLASGLHCSMLSQMMSSGTEYLHNFSLPKNYFNIHYFVFWLQISYLYLGSVGIFFNKGQSHLHKVLKELYSIILLFIPQLMHVYSWK